LAFNADVYKVSKSRIEEVIQLTGLSPESHKKIGQLSKGFRQRVGLATALLHNPDVLILDEPTTGLDPNQLVEIRNVIKNVGKDKTVFLSTHIMQEVEAICDRVIIIDHGKIVREGTPRDLKAQVGAPTLLITVAAQLIETATQVLKEFGDMRPTAEGTLGVGLNAGVEAVTDVIRRLDESGIRVQHLELNEPSLDDVFAEATGYRLEGAKQ
jgi:ABC-2 type transport system ATP-binding protein